MKMFPLNQSSEKCDSLLPLVSPDATWPLTLPSHVASALAAVKFPALMPREKKSGYNIFSILNLILNAIGILEHSTWVCPSNKKWDEVK